jgi:hypothetical protein
VSHKDQRGTSGSDNDTYMPTGNPAGRSIVSIVGVGITDKVFGTGGGPAGYGGRYRVDRLNAGNHGRRHASHEEGIFSEGLVDAAPIGLESQTEQG